MGGAKRVGRSFAHRSSLRFLEFSVKVVRHINWNSFCGRLWKRVCQPKSRQCEDEASPSKLIYYLPFFISFNFLLASR